MGSVESFTGETLDLGGIEDTKEIFTDYTETRAFWGLKKPRRELDPDLAGMYGNKKQQERYGTYFSEVVYDRLDDRYNNPKALRHKKIWPIVNIPFAVTDFLGLWAFLIWENSGKAFGYTRTERAVNRAIRFVLKGVIGGFFGGLQTALNRIKTGKNSNFNRFRDIPLSIPRYAQLRLS